MNMHIMNFLDKLVAHMTERNNCIMLMFVEPNLVSVTKPNHKIYIITKVNDTQYFE